MHRIFWEYASDANFAKNAGFKVVENLETMKLYIVNFFMKNRLTIYGIVEKTTQKLIGSIDLRVRERERILVGLFIPIIGGED